MLRGHIGLREIAQYPLHEEYKSKRGDALDHESVTSALYS